MSTEGAASAGPLIRRAARIAVSDPDGQLLLLASRDPVSGQLGWFLPGGAIEAGESPEEAARRELAEELGINATRNLRGPLWELVHEFSWAGRRVLQTEWCFTLQLASQRGEGELSLGGDDGQPFAASRWLTIDELEQAADTILPRQLLRRLAGSPGPR